MMAFTTPLGEETNNKAEIEAAIFGLTWALELGYRNIILELDSQLVVQWVLKKAVPQWIIITQLGRLQQLITQVHNFKCSNVFREANCVADALTNTVTTNKLLRYISKAINYVENQSLTINLSYWRYLILEERSQRQFLNLLEIVNFFNLAITKL